MQERWRLARWGPDSPFHQEPIPMATVPTRLWEESSLYLSHYFSTLQPEIRLPRRGHSGRHLNCSRPGTMTLPDLAIRSRRLLQTLNRRSRKSRRASRPLLGLAEDKGHWSGSLVDDGPLVWIMFCFHTPLPPKSRPDSPGEGLAVHSLTSFSSSRKPRLVTDVSRDVPGVPVCFERRA